MVFIPPSKQRQSMSSAAHHAKTIVRHQSTGSSETWQLLCDRSISSAATSPRYPTRPALFKYRVVVAIRALRGAARCFAAYARRRRPIANTMLPHGISRATTRFAAADRGFIARSTSSVSGCQNYPRLFMLTHARRHQVDSACRYFIFQITKRPGALPDVSYLMRASALDKEMPPRMRSGTIKTNGFSQVPIAPPAAV